MTIRDAVAAAVKQEGGNDCSAREALLPVLRSVQRETGHLSREVLREVEAQLGIPEHDAYRAASFYDEFHFEPTAQHIVRVCDSVTCELGECRELVSAVAAELGVGPGQQTADGRFRFELANCLGHCEGCPALEVDGRIITSVRAGDIAGLLAAAVDGKDAAETGQEQCDGCHFSGQRLLSDEWRSMGATESWLDGGGASDLLELFSRLSPADILALVEASGLRGHGGAGFPTAAKWKLALQHAAPRVLVCNADESEPGTFKDRVLLQERPFAVLEGMLLAARAIEATRAILYLRSHYAHLQPKLQAGVDALAASGALDGFRVDIRLSGGVYICGEESALLESLEGKRAEPRLRPPYPVESGLFGYPTVVNNVETLANVRWIAEHGADAFREAGCEASPGTKLFSVSGDVAHPGVYEQPLGVTARAVVEEAGGVEDGSGQLGFVLVGGAAGRVWGGEQLDNPLDFEHGVGNGAVTVFDASRLPLRVAASLLRFFSRETCGACLPCRDGVPEARALIESALVDGQAPAMDAFDALAECLDVTSRCGLGKTALRATRDLLALQRSP